MLSGWHRFTSSWDVNQYYSILSGWISNSFIINHADKSNQANPVINKPMQMLSMAPNNEFGFDYLRDNMVLS